MKLCLCIICDFIHSNGTEIIIAFLGAFLGFGLALFLEYLKIRYDKKKEKKNITQIRTKKIEYFLILLNEIIRKSEEQVTIIKEHIQKQKKELLSPISLKHIAMENLFSRLKNIEEQGVFDSLLYLFKFDNTWIKEYNKMNSSLDFLEAEFCEELIRINKDNLEKGYGKLLIIRDLINEIPDILAREAFIKKQQLGESISTDKEFNFIDETIGKFHDLLSEGADFEKYNIELLKPLIEVYSIPYVHKTYVSDIVLNSKRARVEMNSAKKDNEFVISIYQKIIKDLEMAIKDIKRIADMIKNML